MFSSVAVFAQFSFYGGGGYNYTYLPLTQVNQILSLANNLNPSQQVGELHALYGPAVSGGLAFGPIAVNFDFAHRSGFTAQRSTSTDNRLDMTMNTGTVSFGAFPHVGNAVSLGLGLALDYGSARFSRPSDSPLPEDHFKKYTVFNFSPQAQVFFGISNHLFIFSRVYYQVPVIKNDFAALARWYLPAAGQTSDPALFEGDFRNAGVSAGLVFSLR